MYETTTGMEVNNSSKSSSNIYTRYQHYGRELALFLLQHGQQQLHLYLRLLFSANRLCREWILRRWSSVEQHEIAVYICTALAYAKAWLQEVSKPLGLLLSQLISLQIRITTNDHVEDIGTKLSARLNTCLTLLFGAIRLRSHSYLQVCMPSRQPHLQPEFSLVSPSVSPQPGSSPRKHSSRVQQQQQQQQQALLMYPNSTQQQQQQQPGPPRSPRSPRGQGFGSLQQSGAADSEVHLLCSNELKSAIISFLQHHSTTNGQEFVLLRSTSWGVGAGAAAAAATGAEQQQQQQQQQYSSVEAVADPASTERCASGQVVSPGACNRIRQSRQLFQALAENSSSSGSGSSSIDGGRSLISPRLTQSLSALSASQPACCSSSSSSSHAGEEGFAFAACRTPKPHQAAAAAAGGGSSTTSAWDGSSSSNMAAAAAVQRCSWPGPSAGGGGVVQLLQVQQTGFASAAGCGMGLNDVFRSATAAAADGVVSVSIDEPLSGAAGPRSAKQQRQQWQQQHHAMEQQQLQQQQLLVSCETVSAGGGFVPPTANGFQQMDPCLMPLKSFTGSSRSFGPRSSIGSGSSSGSAEHGSGDAEQQRAGCSYHDSHQQQQQQQRPGSSAPTAACSLPGSHRVCDVGGCGYTPPRSVSPIGVPARHGWRKAAKKLPAAPFTLSSPSTAGQQQQQQQQLSQLVPQQVEGSQDGSQLGSGEVAAQGELARSLVHRSR